MINDATRFKIAIERIDAANAEDPNREAADGREYPKELLYAQRMSAMLERFTLESLAKEASEALQLAARSHHIQRWKIARADYPMNRTGYHDWRRQLRDFHAEIAGSLLKDVGYDNDTITRVCSLIKKDHRQQDAEVQTLEDIIVLVFLESYLEDFVHTHPDYDEAKLIEILRKSLRKMSARGRDATLTNIKLPSTLLPTIQKAFQQLDKASN